MAHLALQSVENFTTLYLKLNDFVIGIICVAETSNTKHAPFIYSVVMELCNHILEWGVAIKSTVLWQAKDKVT